MTDTEKQLIEAYLPHPRDPELEFDEYYAMDTAWKVRKVRVVEFLPHEDYTTYGVVESSTGKHIDAGYGSRWIGFRKAALYDNKEDCKNMEHSLYDGWEELRRIQQEEEKK